MANIIVKRWEHINSSLGNWDTPTGKYIGSKKQYYEELKRQNMIPDEEAKRSEDKASQARRKDYKLSNDTLQLLQTIKGTADKTGKVSIGGVAVKKMIDMGAIGKKADLAKLPKHYLEGGFN